MDIQTKPAIAIPEDDHATLVRLAEVMARSDPNLADQLFVELERADVFPQGDTSRQVVRLGSTIEYETDAGDRRVVTLVLPGNENITLGMVSVTTPIGVALIGLSVGDSIEWQTRSGRTQVLTLRRLDQAVYCTDSGS